MNFYTYLGLTPMQIGLRTLERYEEKGLLSKQVHPTLPLAIYCYGRKAVYEGVWDEITSKCRGIVVDTETNEIVSRPFEKFHNYSRGSVQDEAVTQLERNGARVYFWEKMDGFMLTRSVYKGQTIVTSKSSFQSVHAKWAAGMLAKTPDFWPPNTTQVFEGISPNFRIVVNYGDKEELVLLAVIDNDTGQEMEPAELREWARKNGMRIPQFQGGDVTNLSIVYDSTNKQEQPKDSEGFVATWYGDDGTPYRLKLKFIEYMRLHRMITGISPKQIANLLRDGMETEIAMLINDTTPWMAKYVDKWVYALGQEFSTIEKEAKAAYSAVFAMAVDQKWNMLPNMGAMRKAWALEFTSDRYRHLSKFLFAILDGRDHKPLIWEAVKNKMTVGKGPLVQNY